MALACSTPERWGYPQTTRKKENKARQLPPGRTECSCILYLRISASFRFFSASSSSSRAQAATTASIAADAASRAGVYEHPEARRSSARDKTACPKREIQIKSSYRRKENLSCDAKETHTANIYFVFWHIEISKGSSRPHCSNQTTRTRRYFCCRGNR